MTTRETDFGSREGRDGGWRETPGGWVGSSGRIEPSEEERLQTEP